MTLSEVGARPTGPWMMVPKAPSDDPERLAWSEARERRAQEQEAQRLAEEEILRQQLQVAIEESDTVARVRIEDQMQALATQQSQRYRNVRRRDEAARRAQQQFAQRGGMRVPERDALTEGASPEAAFEASLTLTQEVKDRRQRILQRGLAWGDRSQDVGAEQARMDLGRAIDQAVASGLFNDWRGLVLVALGGLNVEPIPEPDVRTLVGMLLAQAVQSGMVTVAQARTVARVLAQVPAVPQASLSFDAELAAVRAQALDLVPLDGTPLTPTGLTRAGDGLQEMARVVPELIDRLTRLEAVVYEALTVLPCHQGHDLHLTTPVLCDAQAGDLARSLLAGLGLSDQALPKDVHWDQERDGARAPCCETDGRIGTWLIYGQYTNPDLRSSVTRRRGATS